jgi:hypothetical protein
MSGELRPDQAVALPVFCHCRVESKSVRIPRVKHRQIVLAIFVLLSAALARAEDFKTIDGKE